MKPFVIKQHEKDYAAHRELSAEELPMVSGGQKVTKLHTITVNGNGTSGDDGADAD